MHQAFAAATTVVALALSTRAGPAQRRPPLTPPPAAIDACKDLKAGDRCSFVFDGETLEGTCLTPLGDVVCVPYGHPPRPSSR